jgi:MFS family permease
VIFTLGSLLCGLARDPLMLILWRSGQGIGGAIMFATSLALLGHSFRGRDRGVAFGVWGAITGVSTALGPVLGGAAGIAALGSVFTSAMEHNLAHAGAVGASAPQIVTAVR